MPRDNMIAVQRDCRRAALSPCYWTDMKRSPKRAHGGRFFGSETTWEGKRFFCKRCGAEHETPENLGEYIRRGCFVARAQMERTETP